MTPRFSLGRGTNVEDIEPKSGDFTTWSWPQDSLIASLYRNLA